MSMVLCILYYSVYKTVISFKICLQKINDKTLISHGHVIFKIKIRKKAKLKN